MKIVSLLILMFSINLWAVKHKTASSEFIKNNTKKQRVANQEEKIEVLTYSKEYPIEQLEGAYYQKHERTEKSQQEVMQPEIRNEILSYAGLHNFVSFWDQLELDILILRAQNNSRDTLLKKYPSLPKEGLLKLQDILKDRTGERRK